MQYANIDGKRRTAEPGLNAVCGHCGSAVHAKCGSKVVWHWAHQAVENCDSWYEPETLWHRDWKSHFGINCSEISLVKEGIRHIADVLTKDELVIEFQNSPIASETIVERELFYGKMLWVINGAPFKDNFQIWDKDYAQNWEPKTEVHENFHHPILHKKIKALVVQSSEIKQQVVRKILLQQKFVQLPDNDLYYYDLSGHTNSFAIEAAIRGKVLKIYRENTKEQKHKPVIYEWKRARPSWLDAKAPVFIDFNDDYLIWIKTNVGSKKGEGSKVSKKEFLAKYASP